MWKSSIFNASDSRDREYTCGARAVLAPLYIQSKVQEKKLPCRPTPFLLLDHLLSSLHLVRSREGRVEDRVQQPTLQFPFSLTSLLFRARCPNCAEPREKNLRRFLSSRISHWRKELRSSNLIRLGPLCLNPRSKVFNQLGGGGGGTGEGSSNWAPRGTGMWVEGREGGEELSCDQSRSSHPAREEPTRHYCTPAFRNAKQLLCVGHFRTIMIIKKNPKHAHIPNDEGKWSLWVKRE